MADKKKCVHSIDHVFTFLRTTGTHVSLFIVSRAGIVLMLGELDVNSLVSEPPPPPIGEAVALVETAPPNRGARLPL